MTFCVTSVSIMTLYNDTQSKTVIMITFSITSLSIMILCVMTLSIVASRLKTLIMVIFSITTLNIRALSVVNIHPNNTHHDI
jgi:hypothetical protein